MITFPLSQSDFLGQNLDSDLIKSTSCPPSSLADEEASKTQGKNFIALSGDRITDTTYTESSVPSDEKAKAASEDANLKIIWDDTMKDFGLTGKPHRDTAVLMISWAKEFDDLHTGAEVDELEGVFTELFHYRVDKRQLSDSGERQPSLQISKYLIDFVYEFDSDATLLIVYYAGHGIPGKPGELHLAGYGHANACCSHPAFTNRETEIVSPIKNFPIGMQRHGTTQSTLSKMHKLMSC